MRLERWEKRRAEEMAASALAIVAAQELFPLPGDQQSLSSQKLPAILGVDRAAAIKIVKQPPPPSP